MKLQVKMKLKIAEKTLLKPVKRFLKERGCLSVVPELQFVDRGIDLYAYTEQGQCSYAVELKVTDWQKALRQAAIYQLCADLCYVAMPSEYATRADLNDFRDAGVGLLSVEMKSSDVTELLVARVSSVKSHFYSHCFYESLNLGRSK